MSNNATNHTDQPTETDSSWVIHLPSSQGWTKLHIGNANAPEYHTVTYAFGDKEACLARARLISAAPELLEALERFADIPGMEEYGFETEMPLVRAAIAKAKGEAIEDEWESGIKNITVDDDDDSDVEDEDEDAANKPVVFVQWRVSEIREYVEACELVSEASPALCSIDDAQFRKVLEYHAYKGYPIYDRDEGLLFESLEDTARHLFFSGKRP